MTGSTESLERSLMGPEERDEKFDMWLRDKAPAATLSLLTTVRVRIFVGYKVLRFSRIVPYP